MPDPAIERPDVEAIFNSPGAVKLNNLARYWSSPEGKRAMDCMERICVAMLTAFDRFLIVRRLYLRPDIAESLGQCWPQGDDGAPKKIIAFANPAGGTVPVSIVDGLEEEFVLSIAFGVEVSRG